MRTLLALIFSTLPIALIAQELPSELSIKGAEYHDVKFVRRDEARVTFTHAGGIAAVKIKDLPEDVRAGIPYDPQKAEAILSAQRARNKAIYEAENAEWKKREAITSANFAETQAIKEKAKERLDVSFKIRQIVSGEGVLVTLLRVGENSISESESVSELEPVFIYGDFSKYVDGDKLSMPVWRAGKKEYSTVLFATKTVRAFAESPELALQISTRE